MNKIVEIKFGSHLYGTATENSDLDYKGIYLPTAKEILLGRYKKNISISRPKQPFERNTKDDIDLEYISLDQYVNLLLQGQTMALDMLFSVQLPEMVKKFGESFDVLQYLFDNKLQVLHRKINSFVGYARVQASKYGQKGFRVHAYRATLNFLKEYPNEQERIEVLGIPKILSWIASINNKHVELEFKEMPDQNKQIPHIVVCGKYIPLTTTFKHTKGWLQKYFDEYGQRALMAERNEGVDWKALSHSVRVNSEALELLKTGFITFPRPDKELLLKIKLGQVDFKEVSLVIEQGLESLNDAEKYSFLKDEPNRDWADQFVCDIYGGIVKKG